MPQVAPRKKRVQGQVTLASGIVIVGLQVRPHDRDSAPAEYVPIRRTHGILDMTTETVIGAVSLPLQPAQSTATLTAAQIWRIR